MHLPLVFMDGPYRMTMGLRAMRPGDWLWRDEHLAADLAERRRLVTTKRYDVIASLNGSEPACSELLAMVIDDLARYHGVAAELAEASPLATLAGLTQEDWCLLQPAEDGSYFLTAGLLCFPLHWRLREKLGLPLRRIHGPVPGFDAKLGDPVDRFFTALEVDRPVWRANWTLTEKPDLHQPGAREPVPDLTSENVGERFWLRVERQTLRRLPRTRAVVFGIRSLVRPLQQIGADPAVAAAMAARIREMPADTARYKGIPPIREPLLAWLDRRAQQTVMRPTTEPAAAFG
jgi:hypothetical protein